MTYSSSTSALRVMPDVIQTMRAYRRAGVVGATLFLAATAWAPAALAQRDTAAVRDTIERPFVRGGVYDKPYLTRLGGRTTLGGYADVQARYERVDGLRDDSGFEVTRFNLFTNARVSDFVRIGAELEIEDGGREIKLEYAAIDVRIHPSLTVRGGMLLSPLGKFNLAHDSPLNEFTDRPLVSTELLGVALSEPGLGAFGQFGVARTGRLTYELYATNGFHDGLITESEDGTRIPLGRGNFEDNNNSAAFVGRIALSPSQAYEVGISAHHGAYNVSESEGTQIDERRNLTIVVLDAEAQVFGVHLAGEAASASIDVDPELEGIYASRQRGAYAEAVRPFGRGWVRTMPSSSFAVKARFDYVDFDSDAAGQETRQVSLGLNFRPTQDTALKFDYVRGRSRDEFNTAADHAFVLFSLATYF